jgi:hypothetical protein
MLEFLAYHPFAIKLIIVVAIVLGIVWIRGLDYYLDHWREIDNEERQKRMKG